VPRTETVFYKEGENVLFEQWLKTLRVKVQAKCPSQVRLLRSQGHELRRPIADFLRDGIYGLRPTHGLSKEAEVPAVEINRAIERKKK
jgi:hypothetical protein